MTLDIKSINTRQYFGDSGIIGWYITVSKFDSDEVVLLEVTDVETNWDLIVKFVEEEDENDSSKTVKFWK